jgi:branched-chain amino acid transport system ATP-binding protein
MLEVKNLHVGYGELGVVWGISFAVRPGEVIAVLGRNGAGKTTTLSCLAGLLHPTRGRVMFDGRDISTTPAHEVANLGIALVPEGRRLFPKHTVRENLELGAYRQLRQGRVSEFLNDLDVVVSLFPRVGERLGQPAGLLSGGEQQMVAIARALVSRPKLLLLDEPSLGLSPILVGAIFEVFGQLSARGMTMVLVEQMARAGLKLCDRALVMENGRIVLEGTPQELTSEPRLMEAYLGTPVDFGKG